MSEPTARTAADRCPGVFSTHPAADGPLARIRLPGGRLRAEQLQVLATVAADHGDGYLELTVRGNLQLRGITDVSAVAEAVVSAGLAPSSAHDKVRNIAISPLTGRIGGLADVRPLSGHLESALREHPGSAALSGRFLFGLDDGRGDVIGHTPDAAALIRSAADAGDELRADILVGTRIVGSAVGDTAIVDALLRVADGLKQIAPTAWRVRDLDDDALARLTVHAAEPLAPAIAEQIPVPDANPIVGWFDQDDGRVLLGGVIELARLPARLAEFLAAVDAPIVITPDREILICDLTEGVAETVVRVLAPLGLIFDANSPWVRVTACAGAPGCANSLTPVREDARARVADAEPITEREHWIGCDRGCGTPAGHHVRVEAGPEGYQRKSS
ncbi:precorrin-3B synthase [Gordonia sp. ABSL1-1]|uniref:precorrin-3B synthase n=1 Tax=Gordonia sp. ABSL1-1 TaxID=3053923 RepID=UPI0025723F0C|nr:precorrin-3B synthase [Gordonia sp. ABSL1-1]MDL9935921.1 precorrin-3B synthase [Gordonia sp. ABSL1-1]